MRYWVLSCLAVFFSLAGAEKILLQEKFDRSAQELRAAGWRVPKEVECSSQGVVITAKNDQRAALFLDFPVTPGAAIFYGGELEVRPDGVCPRNNSDRGATLFLGLLDGSKKWINGGGFPRGYFGKSGWQKVKLPPVRIDNPNVKFLQIWVVVEGQGRAEFRNLKIVESGNILECRMGMKNNLPCFEFKTSHRVNPKNFRKRIAISRRGAVKPEFEFLTSAESFSLPHALEEGKWNIQISGSDNKGEFPVARMEYDAPQIDKKSIRRFTPDFPNGRFSALPQLAFDVYPPLTAGELPVVKMDGNPVRIMKSSPSRVVFSPEKALNPGVFQVSVEREGNKSSFLFVNKDPAEKITFRDDKIMLIDGKPFFPVGTYRDPSDKRTRFDGIKEAGFNLTGSYEFERASLTLDDMRQYLADCTQNGVRAYLSTRRSSTIADDMNAVEKLAAESYGERGLLSLYLPEEPVCSYNFYSVRNTADAVKRTVPGMPRSLLLDNVDNTPVNRFYGDGCSDILWHDPYPVPRRPVGSVYRSMLDARKLCHDKQPVWAVIQCFDWKQSAVRKMKPEEVEPKAGKIRCMTHLAIAAGSRGIVFYWLPNDRYDMKIHSPVQWREVCATARELNSLMPFLTGREESGEIKLPDGVHYWSRRASDGRKVTVFVNGNERAVTFSGADNKKVTLPAYGVEIVL